MEGGYTHHHWGNEHLVTTRLGRAPLADADAGVIRRHLEGELSGFHFDFVHYLLDVGNRLR